MKQSTSLLLLVLCQKPLDQRCPWLNHLLFRISPSLFIGFNLIPYSVLWIINESKSVIVKKRRRLIHLNRFVANVFYLICLPLHEHVIYLCLFTCEWLKGRCGVDDKCVWLHVRISSPVSLAWWEMMSHLLFNQFLLSLTHRRRETTARVDKDTPFPLVPFFLLQTDLPLKQQVYFLQATNEEAIAEQKWRGCLGSWRGITLSRAQRNNDLWY